MLFWIRDSESDSDVSELLEHNDSNKSPWHEPTGSESESDEDLPAGKLADRIQSIKQLSHNKTYYNNTNCKKKRIFLFEN